MLARGEGIGPRRAPAADFLIVSLIRPVRRLIERQVGNGQKKLAQFFILGARLVGQPGDFGLLFGHKAAKAFKLRLIAARLGGADLLRGGVLCGLRGFGGKNAPAPRLVQRKDLRRQRRHTGAPRQAAVKLGGIVADGADIVHGFIP